MQNEKIEIYLGLFLELAEKKNNTIYNQIPVNTLIEDMEKNFNGWFFTLGEEGEIDISRFFKDKDELAKFIGKIIDKSDDQIYVLCFIQLKFTGILEVLNE